MKLATAFNYRKPNNRQTKQGQSGYDNARENIDPHIRTKTVSQLQGTIEQVPANAKDIANKEYVDSQTSAGSSSNRVYNSYVNLGGESTCDVGMLGLYDKNQLANATEKGSCTITIIGAGTAVPSQYFNMFNSEGNHAQVVTGINATTSKIEIVIDTGSLQANYSSAKWHPFIQMRLGFNATGTHPRMVAVEVSNDGISWYMPSSGQWITADIGTDSQVPGYWFGTSGLPNSPSNLPGWRWRYAKFTLEDFYINPTYSSRDKLWISQLGVRHHAHTFCPQYPKIAVKNVFLDENYFIDKVGIGTQSPTELLDISSDAIRLRTAQTPASAGATGTAGTICWDTNYIYVCTATNTWKRTALSTW